MKLNKLFLIFVIFQVGICFSQTTVEKRWVRIESQKKDFSLALPEGFVVDIDDKTYRLHAFQKDISIYVSFGAVLDPKSHFKLMFSYLKPDELAKYRFLTSGDFICAQLIGEKTTSKFFSFTLASSKGFYEFHTSSDSQAENEIISKFAASIRLDGKQMFNTSTSITEVETIQLSSLKTDTIVLEAIKQKDSLQKKAVEASDIEKKLIPETKGFSRQLIVLRKTRATYTETARSQQIQGTVKLLVTFLASGQIGEIKIVSTPGGDLETTAFKAARKIKFLPAEIGGKPVDVKRYVEYTFTLY